MTARSESPEASLPDGRLTFTRAQRLRSGLDFERLYALKNKAADQRLILFGARNVLGITRLGMSVSRRHGNSVIRHRLRRMLREAFRLEQLQLPAGIDLILIPGRDALAASLAEWRRSLVQLARRLDKRLPMNAPSVSPSNAEQSPQEPDRHE